jgi:hypothetical protein
MKKLILFLVFIMPTLVIAAAENTAVVVDPSNPEPVNKILMWATIAITVLFGISEALSAIPSVKANSIYQLIHNILKALVGKESK